MPVTTWRACAAEFLATGLLLAIVVGSGIMGERLAAGNTAIALLANSLATAAGLVALILTFGPVSGAHLNPLVTAAEASLGSFAPRRIGGYAVAQLAGAFAGVALAHSMFELPVFTASAHARAGFAQGLAEFVATYSLLLVVLTCSRSKPAATPYAVAAIIGAGYWFTASTCFANPAVTLARAATDTFAGIRLDDVPVFLLAQVLGAAAAVLTFRTVFVHRDRAMAKTVVFACVHNAGRSQMAAAFFNALANPRLARAVSAGTQPGPNVHPEVIAAMHEVGIPLAGSVPTRLTAELTAGASLLVTMGCGETCPMVPGLRREDWPLPDPKGRTMEAVREIRDAIKVRVVDLIARTSGEDFTPR